ncbi:MAG: TetR/AcrR family transcriptional regulator [Spongiibacteraceae bacterium]
MQSKKNQPNTRVKKASATTVTRKRRSSEEIMERLVTAAREEFKRSGYVGATTAVIARNAEVTEAQLFRYFSSKADLFREAVFDPLDKHFSAFNARYPEAMTSDDNIRERARIYITELQEFLDEHSKLLLSLVVAQLFTSGSASVGQGQGVGEIESLRHYFERGAAMMSGRVDADAPVDPKLLVRVSFAAVLGCVLFKDWIFPEGLANDKDIRSAIIDFVIDGISVNDVALQKSATTQGSATTKKSSTTAKKAAKK